MRVSPAPPRDAAQARLHALPAPLTRLIGRSAEVAAVRDALLTPGVRLLTLVGAPGIGKTRLALAVAHALLGGPPAGADRGQGAEPGFTDGVFFVPLAALHDPELVVPAIAQALDIRETGGELLRQRLKAALRDRRMLLMLDNCEHLLAVSPAIAELLGACPGLTVLATSRAPLHLYGEHLYPVPPLTLPGPVRIARPEALARVPAVALLLERARAVRPDFALTAQNAPAVVEVCVRLDGLPLAIELAAARLKLLPPNAIVARLGSRLDLLTDGARDRPERHQTLRAALAWSHDLLSAGEQRLLRRLAVFVGGWTLEAAEAVCNPDGELAVDVLDGIAALMDQSLVQEAEQPDGEPRYTMLETIREYAIEQLDASGEAAWIRGLHAQYCLSLAEIARPRLISSDQGVWRSRLEAEHDNIRAALAWSLEAPEGVRIALRLPWALYRFWQRGGHVGEGREWVARALARSGSAQSETQAMVLNAAGVLARAQGDNAPARSYFGQSLSIYRQLEDSWGVANALLNLASVILYEGNFGRATTLLNESLTTWRELGDRWGLAQALMIRGLVAQGAGEANSAIALHEESLRLLRQVGDLWGIATQLGELGVLAGRQGQFERAATLFNQCLAMRQGFDDLEGVAWSLWNLGRVAFGQRDFTRASSLYRQSLRLYRELGHRWAPIVCLEGLAAVEVMSGQAVRSAVLLGAAEVLREAIGEPLPSPERADCDQSVAAVRTVLGEEDIAVAWAEGRAMTPEQAIEYALTPPELASSPAALAEQPPLDTPADPLTAREREVAGLVARGLTDAQLAEALVISRRTAEKHVANCLGKLGLATRAGLAAWAVERGLPAPRPD